MDKTTFELRIEISRADKAALRAIADELKALKEPWAGPLRIKALQQIIAPTPEMPLGSRPRLGRPGRELKKTAASDIPEWAARFDLPRPDGRPLYRYRLSSPAFARIENHLRSRTLLLREQPSRGDTALFVLWAAEWFRRAYRGGGQRWEDLGRALGMSAQWAGWRRLADTGLKQWRISELWINGAHYRLAAIARQGGFPVAAFEGGGSGWAARYLERLVGLLLTEPDPTLELADRHALQLSGSIPETWRNEEMRIVSAELALEVVRLRREAEAGGAIAGSLVSAWLDHHRPDWRDELPLVIEGDSGRALVDGLMRAVALKGGSGAISATRLLILGADDRQERVRLTLDGSLESAAGRVELGRLSSHWSRLRLYATGALAQYTAGELALVEPEEEGRWSARSTTRTTEFPLPFSVPVQAELRGEGQRVCGPFFLPGGDAVGEGMRVYSATKSDETRLELTLLATASGGFRAEELFVDLPNGWTIKPHADESVCEQRHGQAGQRSIWSLRGSGLVTSERGDCYLLRAGQSGDKRDTLSLVGDCPRLCFHAEAGVPLFKGWPRLELCDGGRSRGPSLGEGWWRLKGEVVWRPYSDTKPPGRVEIAWKDATTGHIRDRREAAVLPEAFEIRRLTSGNALTLELCGWPGQISFDRGDQISATQRRFPARGTYHDQCTAALKTENAPEIALLLPLPHRGQVSDWGAVPVRPNTVISLAEISQFVARTEGRCELMADLLDRSRKPVPQGRMSWFVDGELPLSAIRDDLEGLLRPLGDIDARIRLNFNDGNEDYWFVSEFGVTLKQEGRGLVPDRAITQEHVQVIGRALADPIKERADFGTYGLSRHANHRPIELPTLTGDWLIYLRQEDRVLSRPYFVRGLPLHMPPQGALARAMAYESREDRLTALDELCSTIVEESSAPASRATLRSIVDLALSLRGLPPSTFDILMCLVTRPELGPLMLFEAASNEVEPLMRLADGLPFSWSIFPKRYWEAAARAQFEVLIAAMPDAFPLFAEAISGRRRQIAELEPILAPQLELPGSTLSAKDAAQAFLNRSGDRIAENGANPFRPALEPLLPGWNLSEHFYRALDAPRAAALAAQEKAELDLGQIYAIKDMARQHPRYFREAYAAALRENSFG